MPETAPVADTVAVLLLLLHTPPVTTSVRASGVPMQTFDAPVILLDGGATPMVTDMLVIAVPQELVTV